MKKTMKKTFSRSSSIASQSLFSPVKSSLPLRSFALFSRGFLYFIFRSGSDGRLRQLTDRVLRRRGPAGARRCCRRQGGGGNVVGGIGVRRLSAARRGAGGHLRRRRQGEQIKVQRFDSHSSEAAVSETRSSTRRDEQGRCLTVGIERFFFFLLSLSPSPPSRRLACPKINQPSTSVADYMNLPSPVRYEELQREVMSESERG